MVNHLKIFKVMNHQTFCDLAEVFTTGAAVDVRAQDRRQPHWLPHNCNVDPWSRAIFVELLVSQTLHAMRFFFTSIRVII